MPSDIEVCMKQRGRTELLHVGKNGTHWHSLALAEHVWRPESGCEHSEGWVVHLSSGDSDLKVTEVMFQTAMRSYHTTSEEHLYQLICMNQWIPTRGLCTELNTSVKLQCIGNSGDNVRISQFMPGWSHECWRRNWKNTICEFVRTYWTNARLMVTVPWIT